MTRLNLWRSAHNSPQRNLAQNPWDIFSVFENEINPFLNAALSSDKKSSTPTCDLTETETSFLLSFDVPGIKKEEIAIDVTGTTLTVSGERTNRQKNSEGNVHRMERSFGKFRRQFDLPDGSKVEDIQANYENGVLELSIPKPEKAKSKKIVIGNTISTLESEEAETEEIKQKK